MTSQCAITLDLDWAPDFAIDLVAERLRRAGVCATFFVTHDSPAVRRLAADAPYFELGVHPNFDVGSSHGASTGAVMEHVMSLVPEARVVRSHRLLQSMPILDRIFEEPGLQTDLSLFLPGVPHLRPFEYARCGRRCRRVPYFWEDSFEAELEAPAWDPTVYAALPGLQVFNFHPIHVFLNSNSMGPYRQLRAAAARMSEVTAEQAEPYCNVGALGAADMFGALLERCQHGFAPTISELVAGTKAGCSGLVSGAGYW